MRVALWRYRVRVSGFELPAPVATAQQEFDEALADVMEGMADRPEGKTSQGKDDFEDAFDRLERTVRYGVAPFFPAPTQPLRGNDD